MNTRLRWPAIRVLKALPDTVVSALLKVVAVEFYGLENEDMGCTKTQNEMARRLGMSPNTLKWARSELQRLHILRNAEERRGAGGRWYVDVPPEYVPASMRPTDAVVIDLAQRWALELGRLGGPVQPLEQPCHPVLGGEKSSGVGGSGRPVSARDSSAQGRSVSLGGPGHPLIEESGCPTPPTLNTETTQDCASVGEVLEEMDKIQPVGAQSANGESRLGNIADTISRVMQTSSQ